MAKVWDKPITAETDWGGDASTDNLPVSGRQVQAWIKSNIKSDAQISQFLVSWLNTHTINSPVFWKGLPIDADTLSWDGDKLTVIGSDGESQPIDEQFLINFLQENGYLTKDDYPFVYDAEKKAWLFTGDLVATGAITMFGDFNKFKPSTIMDAVQVDDITIGKTTEGVLYAKSGGGSGGSGMSYEEINQIVSNAIQNKADKATTLEGYGIEDAYDKSYIDTLAYKLTTVYNWGDHSKAGYVFKDTKQDISARHNFTNGIEIGGLAAYKSKDDVVFLDANLVVRGAITMYGDNGTTSKTIWENIPFDSTMEWKNSMWSVAGGAGGVDTNAVNTLINEALVGYATQSWVQSQKYLTSHQDLSHLLSKKDAENTYQKIISSSNKLAFSLLKDIPDYALNSTLETAVSTLNTEIGKKWTQDDAKISNWDTAYSWGNHANAGYAGKSYVDTEFAKYVKLATAQSISAQHNFTSGLKINGLPITKASDGTLYIDANVVVSGALTMFGNGSTTFPTIWANIPFDSSMRWDGSKWSVVGGSGGGVDVNAVNTLINEALVGYAKQSWVQSQGYLTQHQSLSHLLSKTDAANTYQTIINSTNKLAYSNISGTPDLSVYALKTAIPSLSGYATEQWVGDNYLPSSNFTKANIKSTLGISDWALASTKPSYTAAEVGALATSGGTISGTDEAVLKINTSYAVGVAVNFRVGGKSRAWVGYNTSDGAYLGDSDWGYTLRIGTDGTPYYDSYELIHLGNIGSYNAGSATKLQTPRTIWGQSFDGTADISGAIKNVDVIRNARSNWIIGEASLDGEVHIGSASFAQARTLYNANGMLSLLANGTFRLLRREDTPPLMHSILTYEAAPYGLLTRINTDGSVSLQAQRETNDAECFRLLLNPLGGNVAIGGTTADAKLHVHGSILSGGLITSNEGYTFTDANATYCGLMPQWRISSDGDKSSIWLYNTGLLYYHASQHNFTDGNVAIGGTTADAKLHIWGDVKAGGATFSSNNSCNLILNSNAQSVTFATLQIDNVAKGYVGYSKDGVFLQNGTASWAYITVSDDGKFVTSCDAIINGNILATGAITMFSQLSMKNVIDYDGLSLAQLAQIRPARFTWKDNRDNRTHVGGIADYIQPILPEVVYETVNKELTVDYGSAAFYIGTSLIKPVIDHEKRITYLENENKRKDEIIISLQNQLKQLTA